MHFEVLVEDQSGKAMLANLIPRIVGPVHTFRITDYKGLGHLPKGLKPGTDARKRVLLDRLPTLLQAFGRSLRGIPAAVMVVCDLDDRCLKAFRAELHAVLAASNPAPLARFCVAIEEGEAWLLGDLAAVRSVYPKARERVLTAYVNDSICGTWETLADAVYPGGAVALRAKGSQAVGAEKSRWATAIAPHVDPDANRSPSFQYFRRQLQRLAAGANP